MNPNQYKALFLIAMIAVGVVISSCTQNKNIKQSGSVFAKIHCFSKEEMSRVHHNNILIPFSDSIVYYRFGALIKPRKKRCIGLYSYEYWFNKNGPSSNTIPYYPILKFEDRLGFYTADSSQRKQLLDEFVESYGGDFTYDQIIAIKYYFNRYRFSLHK